VTNWIFQVKLLNLKRQKKFDCKAALPHFSSDLQHINFWFYLLRHLKLQFEPRIKNLLKDDVKLGIKMFIEKLICMIRCQIVLMNKHNLLLKGYNIRIQMCQIQIRRISIDKINKHEKHKHRNRKKKAIL
jgi:hypothetical protein